MLSLKGQNALITGASSGIGKAIALRLAQEGCHLYLTGRNEARLLAVQAKIEQVNGKARILNLDIGISESVSTLASTLLSEGIPIQIVVHSAGVFHRGPFQDVSEEMMDQLYAVNWRGPFLLTKNLLPLMNTNPSQVVFINSSAGISSVRGQVGAYAASKHALRALTDGFRSEVNPLGIRVLSVYPGRTATPMQKEIFASEGRAYPEAQLLQPEDIAETIVHSIKLPLTAEITDIQIRPFNKV